MPRKPAPRSKSRSRPKSSRDKVHAYRARMRKQGLRPVQFWLPDVRSPEFAAEAHKHSLAVANSPNESEDQAFIDSITDPDALYERTRN